MQQRMKQIEALITLIIQIKKHHIITKVHGHIYFMDYFNL